MSKPTTLSSEDFFPSICCLSQDSADYPKRLCDLSDPPRKLFYIGNIALLRQPMLAIVGARRAPGPGYYMPNILQPVLGLRDITSSLVLPTVSTAPPTAAY